MGPVWPANGARFVLPCATSGPERPRAADGERHGGPKQIICSFPAPSVLYSSSRGCPTSCPDSRQARGRSARGLQPGRSRLVRGVVRDPTAAQVGGWAAIAAGRHTLIHAPTGSGKTLAAFLWCLDRLVRDPSPPPTREQPGAVRILYVSPLKALSYDIERNLRAPLAGIALAAGRRGDPVPSISVGLRTGDTPTDERRRPEPAGRRTS